MRSRDGRKPSSLSKEEGEEGPDGVKGGGEPQPEWYSLGVGDNILDSAADGPRLPDEGQLPPAEVQDGERQGHGALRAEGGALQVRRPGRWGALGLRFQFTDVCKALLSVRRLVERRNRVALPAGDGGRYVSKPETTTKIPATKKGGSFH